MSETPPSLDAIKARQQGAWSSGDYSAVAPQVQFPSEVLVDSAGLHAGQRVLDVACGSGNATLAAARRGTEIVGLDYVSSLLERARERTAAERLRAEYVEGDAENLPFEDGTFDAVISVLGVMFAPNQERAAAELVRVLRPGGTLGLVVWSMGDFVHSLFKILTGFAPPPPGLRSPFEWASQQRLGELFGGAVADLTVTEKTVRFSFRSTDDFVRAWIEDYGPSTTIHNSLDDDGKGALREALAELANVHDQNDKSDAVVFPALYTEVIAKRR